MGKSALINRLLGRKVAPSAPRPGVTRQLRWLRLGGDVDLLDTPGDRDLICRGQKHLSIGEISAVGVPWRQCRSDGHAWWYSQRAVRQDNAADVE